jgi:hypothetical protein
MYCKYCGKKIDDDSTYCSGCGAKLSIAVKPESRRRARRIIEDDAVSDNTANDTDKLYQGTVDDTSSDTSSSDNNSIDDEFEPTFSNILGQFSPFGKLVFIVLCLLIVVWVATLMIYIFYPEYINFLSTL